MNSHKICERCKDKFCCNYHTVTCDKSNVDTIEYLKVKGNEILEETENHIIFIMPEPCLHQDQNGLCKIYNERPKVCRDFPPLNGKNRYSWALRCELLREIIKNQPQGYRWLKNKEK